MAKFGKRSKISDNLSDYSLILLGEGGIGKTTVISEVCEKEFGEDGYLLLNVGDEEGVSAIDNVTYEDVESFKKFDEVTKDIIKNKDKDYPDLKVVVIDTLDQLIDHTQKYAVDTWNRENMSNKNFKKAKTINSVEGGFGAGYDVVFNYIYDRVRALLNVGVRTWYICHTKTKDVVDPLSNVSYNTLTSSLAQRYFNDFKTKVHVVGVACIDRVIETESTGRKDIITHKDITVNKIKNERRKIVFRDDNYSVDSKSRFANIVDEIPLDSDSFIAALKDAINNSKKTKIKKTSEIKTEKLKPAVEKVEDDILDEEPIMEEDEVVEIEEMIEEDESSYPDSIAEDIKTMFRTADKDKKLAIKTILKDNNCKVDTAPQSVLEELYDLLTA